MSQFYDAGNYRYGMCPRCKNATNTMVLDANTGTYTCMACGHTGTRRKHQQHIVLPEDSRLHELNAAASQIFRETLYTKYGAEALEYLKKRGIRKETIEAFGLGYASNGRFARMKLEEMGFLQKELVDSGLYKLNEDGTLWFRYSGRVMFTLRDAKGRAIGFSGRVMDKSEPKYKNTPETEVFHKRENLFAFDRAIKSGKNHLVLCEGQMDVIAMHQAGFTNAVASLGTSVTDIQVRMIRKLTDLVIILYDSDSAGQTATKRAIGMLESAGIRAFVANTLPCKDPDEFIQKYGPEAFAKKLKHPLPALDYQLQHAVRDDGSPDFDETCGILLRNYDGDAAMKTIKTLR